MYNLHFLYNGIHIKIKKLNQKIINGVSWNATTGIVAQLFSYIINILLARLLLPTDFGIVSMITVFTGFANILLDLGFSKAIIQSNKINNKLLSTVFFINLSSGVIIFFLFVIFRYNISNIFHTYKLVQYIPFLALNFIINSVALVPHALISRDMEFDIIGKINIYGTVIGGLFGVVMGLLECGVWALISQILIANLVITLFYYYYSYQKWKLKFLFNISSIKSILGFSSNMTMLGIVRYTSSKADDFLLGKYQGAMELGYYSKSYSYLMIPLNILKSKIIQVLFPAFSTIKGDFKKQRYIYINISIIIAALVFPFVIGFFSISKEFVLVLLGYKWKPIIIYLQIFCLASLFNAIGFPGPLITANGRPDLLLKLTLVSRCINILLLSFGLYYYNVIGVVIGVSIGTVFNSCLLNYFSLKMIEVKILDFYIKLFPYFLLSLIMYFFILLIDNYFLVDYSLLTTMAIKVLIGTILYCLCLLIFMKKQINIISKFIRNA